MKTALSLQKELIYFLKETYFIQEELVGRLHPIQL